MSAINLRLSRLLSLSFLTLTLNIGCDQGEDEVAMMGEAGESMSSGDDLQPLPEPIEGCNGPMVEDRESPLRAESQDECVTCEGAPTPDFILEDLSPTSCGYRRHYGLDQFMGRFTFVVLLRSTCGYCHAQLEKLEQLRFELLAMGHELQLVVINQRGTAETVELLSQRTQAPILQDVESVMAWEAMSSPDPEEADALIGGDKDDMYIYNERGELWRFLDDDDPAHKLNLSTPEGYTYLKETLIEGFSQSE